MRVCEEKNAGPVVFTRRAFLGVCAAGGLTLAGGAAYLKIFEPGNFEITRRKLPLPGGPYGGTLLHISDFHASDEVNLGLLRRAVSLAEKIRPAPDAIVMTGDFMTDTLPHKEEFLAQMKRLRAIAPCYVSFGNHDGSGWAKYAYGLHESTDFIEDICRQAGAVVLNNQRCDLELPAGKVILAGLADLWSGKMRPELTLRESPDKHPVILLSHNPDSKDWLTSWHWDAMLSGHTHGGQCVVPVLNWRPVLPVKDKRFVAGLYDWHGRALHITRGVGALHGVRFNCRPELSLLEV